MDIPKRKLGKTGVEVTILGLGGEGVLNQEIVTGDLWLVTS